MLRSLLMVSLVFLSLLARPVISGVEDDFNQRFCVGDHWNTTLESCLQMDLQTALHLASRSGTNDTQVRIAAGKYTLNGQRNSTDFHDVRNIAIVGSNLSYAKTTIDCGESNSSDGTGLGFFSSIDIRIENIVLKNCGKLWNRTSTHPDHFKVALYFLSCESISIHNVIIANSDGVGMVMYNVLGHNTITNTTFSSNGLKKPDSTVVGGGAVIEYSQCNQDASINSCSSNTLYENVSYTIQSCDFWHNTACAANLNDTHRNKLSRNSGSGRGGGLLISLTARVANITITISSSIFHHNSARLGGGLYYKANSIAKNVRLEVVNTSFTHNSHWPSGYCTIQSHGGAVDLHFFGELRNCPAQNSNSKVRFINCSFANNYANSGGAVSLVVFRGLKSKKMISRVVFSGCNFSHNMARVGSAFFATTWTDQSYGFMTTPRFCSCSFTANTIYSKDNAGMGMGTVYSDSVPLYFSGSTTFTQNNGTALVMSSTSVQFNENTSAIFNRNHGYNGGAIALLNRAWMKVGSHVALTFSYNSATHKGGAIYAASFGDQNVVASSFWKCFIRHKRYNLLPCDWNMTVRFDSNTANSKANSVYTTSLQSCSMPRAEWSTGKFNTPRVFCSWKGWNFANSSWHHEFTTSSARFIRTQNYSSESPIEMFPGLRQSLPFSVYDDLGNNITSDTTFRAYISKRKTAFLDSNYELITMHGIKVNGYLSNDTVTVEIETLAPRVIHMSIDLVLMPCPPGMEMDSTNTECVCIHGLPHIINCSYTERKSQINPYWCMDTEDNFTLVGKWTLFSEVHKFGYYDLPPKVSELQSVCHRMNRQGRLCSQCADGYGFAVFTTDYPCVKCNNESVTAWLFYATVEFVPVTIFFLVIVLLNININSGKTNTLVLLCQIASHPINIVTLQTTISLIMRSDSLSKLVQLIILVPYSMWNLDSLKLLIPHFCLFQKAKMIHILGLSYVTAIYPLLLVFLCYLLIELHGRNFRPVVLLWVPFRKCFGRFHRSFEIKTSVIEAFASFLILSYMKFAQVTAMLLIPNPLYHSNGTMYKQLVLLMDASVNYVSSEHAPYFAMALVVLVFILILPPLFLLLYPFHWFQQCLKHCHLWGPAVTTFADAFQWCYKDGSEGGLDCRFFASLYLFTRLLFVLLLVIFPEAYTLALVELVVTITFILMISFLQPYKRKIYNHLDCGVFALMSLLPSVTLCVLNHYFFYAHSAIINPVLRFGFLLILLLPVVYMAVIFSLAICKRIKRKVNCKRRSFLGYQPLNKARIGSSSSGRVYERSSQMESTGSDEDSLSDSLPYRLLHPNSSSATM